MRPRHENALDQALPAYLLLKPGGADVAEINAAFSAWEIDGDDVQRALDRLVSTPVIRPMLTEDYSAGYPTEVSTKGAAKILGCSKDTVLKFKEAGLLEYRNLAAPNSTRPMYRFSRASVERLRTDYQTDIPTPPNPAQGRRRRVRQPQQNQFKHLRLD